jgi:hypothetical protein
MARELNLVIEGSTIEVLSEVAVERLRQDQKWGQQNHPDGDLGGTGWVLAARESKWQNDEDAKAGGESWVNILLEEVYEALAETDPAKLRQELTQVAAVAVAWIEAIDRRKTDA